jgi:hypothetical protein
MKLYLEELKVAIDKAINKPTKYLSAKQAEQEFGINAKTLLNRSNLPVRSKRFIPTVRLKGGRKKYFERKVLERLIEPVPPEVY